MANVNYEKKLVLEMTEDEALMLADYLNYSKADDGGVNIITDETVLFVTSLIPIIIDKISKENE